MTLRGAVYGAYSAAFVRAMFYKCNTLLHNLSLRGLGIFNGQTSRPTNEDHFIANRLSSIGDGVVLDVGANVGTYSIRLRRANPRAHIYAFEPHPGTYTRLVHNVDRLGITTINVALGSAPATSKIYDYVDKDASSHASLYKGVIESIHKSAALAHDVNVTTLDDFAREHGIGRVSFLKVDTEGHELEVLRGGEGLIRANRVDVIQFEFNEMNVVSRVFFKDFWDFLSNYDFYRMLPDGLVPIREYVPVCCEIFGYQNIVAVLKADAGMSASPPSCVA